MKETMKYTFKSAQWSYENQEPQEYSPAVFDELGNQYEVVSWSIFDGFTLKNIKTGISHIVSEDDFFDNYEAE